MLKLKKMNEHTQSLIGEVLKINIEKKNKVDLLREQLKRLKVSELKEIHRQLHFRLPQEKKKTALIENIISQLDKFPDII